MANRVFRQCSRQRSASATYSARSKPLASAAILVGKPEALNSEIGPTPLRPSWSEDQVDSRSRPTGVTIPIPVTTTRRCMDNSSVRDGRHPSIIKRRAYYARWSTPARVAADDHGRGLAVAGEVGVEERRVAGRPGRAGHQVEGAAGRVGPVAVERGGDQAAVDPEQAGDQLDRPAAGDEVAHVSLERRDRD